MWLVQGVVAVGRTSVKRWASPDGFVIPDNGALVYPKASFTTEVVKGKKRRTCPQFGLPVRNGGWAFPEVVH